MTVAVCTCRRPVHLRACLASLTQQSFTDFEIVVVESGTPRDAREISVASGARYVHEPVPGISRARNAGVRAARGEIVAFIDDDATSEPSWLQQLVAPFSLSRIGAVTGGTRYMRDYGGERFMSDDLDQAPQRPARTFTRNDENWFEDACFGRIGDGMNMAFRRALFANRLRFDERLGRGRILDGGDEHVAFLGVLAMDFEIAHVPAAVVRHPAPALASARTVQRLSLLRSTMAYLVFLWMHFPEHRGALRQFAFGALRRRMHRVAAGTDSASDGAWQLIRAAACAPWTYLRARRAWTATAATQIGARLPSRSRDDGFREDLSDGISPSARP